MPRSIIDTESSRGRLVRRCVLIALVLVVLALALLFAVWEATHRGRPVAFQGNSASRLNLGVREYAT